MGLYQKSWNVREAEFAFSEMRNSGIVCQLAYSAMITIYTRLSLYDKAEEIIGFMREDKVTLKQLGFKPNSSNLDTLLTFQESTRMKRVPRTLDDMLKMMSLYDKAEEIIGFMREDKVTLKQLGFKPNSSNLDTLLTFQEKYEDEEGAIRTLDDMLKMR
ncbi:hypothetical protein F3Y22_tig00112289pilonHSYRG00173 [Hibiscus syriacus]|uniref:Pentatricopeptide repeat-containing protein n=1 Tax=Hibiscus syriacus TaxID=106335 RepID=A0A6A2YBT4_HIBSY|nr:hypothetical protein F3Y22_tig00112289pilonHSYRG00173 [Hibiscus syriacus]